VGSNPTLSAIFLLYIPETSFTERSEDIAYTLGPKGLFKGLPRRSGARKLSQRALIGNDVAVRVFDLVL
jgi:hypothetical protein